MARRTHAAQRGCALITLLTLAVAAGLSPYIPLLFFCAAARADAGQAIRPNFDFMMRWEFLGPLFVIIGVDVVLGKHPVIGAHLMRLGWFVKPATAGLIVAASSDISPEYVVLGVGVAILLAGITHWIQIWLIGALRTSLQGFERVVIGAYSELSTVLVSLLAFLLPPLGAICAGLMISLGLFVGLRRRHPSN